MKYGLLFERRTGLCLWPAALALCLAFAPWGCRSNKTEAASTISMGDPQAASQLVSGFYAVEQGAWRWTKGDFSVLLGVPADAARKGAVLRVRLTAPPPLIAKLTDITLSASVNGRKLPPETYRAAGSYTYVRDVPGNLLATSPVKVDFQLDKTAPPAGEDIRELGIVVGSIGLEPK